MADYSAFEKLLNLPPGSTEGNDINKIVPVIAKGVKDTTEQLEKAVKRVDTLESMAPSELVKHGITMEVLEQDKIDIRERAWKTYNIAEKILERYNNDITRLVDVNDRMYTAGGKLIEAVTGSLDKLYNIVQKIRQEEEMKNLTVVQDTDSGKVMTTADWRTFIETVSEDNIEATDAEIIG